LSVKIYPKKDPSDTSPGVYNYKVRNTLTMTPDVAIVLGSIIRNEIIPASKNNQPSHIGIQTSKFNIIYISNGIEETGALAPYLALFCNIDETCKPKNVSLFKFVPRRVFTSYDPVNGSFTNEERIVDELEILAEYFMSATNLMGAVSHSIDCDHATMIERDNAFMAGIGAKRGVQYGQPVNYVNNSNFGGNNNSDPWNNAPATPVQAQTPPTNVSSASVDDLSALLGSRMITNVKGLKENLLYGDKIKSKKIKFFTA
jgi:hypothetical protein